jgi:hypothetical protein
MRPRRKTMLWDNVDGLPSSCGPYRMEPSLLPREEGACELYAIPKTATVQLQSHVLPS